MTDYISRQAAFEALEKRGVSTTNISRVPVADVRENVKGEWKCNIEWGYGTCSVCGRAFPIRNGNPKADRYNYCPNCGADMRGGNNDRINY